MQMFYFGQEIQGLNGALKEELCLFRVIAPQVVHVKILQKPSITLHIKPGVGAVVKVAAWDPRVRSSSPVGR